MKFFRAKQILAAAKYVMVIGLVLVALRSFAIQIFNLPMNNSFVVPASMINEPESTSFNFAVASDTGAKNAPIERIVKKVQKKGAHKFILYLGDLVRYRNISHFRWILSELDEKLELPWYMIPGNHEIENRFRKVDKSLYKSAFGPLYYWFSYGNTVFIGLDSSEEKYDDQQLEWLENIFRYVRPHFKYCIIYTHVPPFHNPQWSKKWAEEASVLKLRQILKDNRVDLVLSGHVHQYSEGEYEGIRLVTLMPSGQKIRGGQENFGYVSVQIEKNGIAVTPHYLENNLEEDNEYFEMLLSSILVDDRMLLIAVSVLGLGILLAIIGLVAKGRERLSGGAD